MLSAISQHARRIRLGTAIVNVYSRSDMQVAMAAATLDELSGGIAILGLSIGHHPWNDLVTASRSRSNVLARLREYVAFIRKAASGEHFRHDGRHWESRQQGTWPSLSAFRDDDAPTLVAISEAGLQRSDDQGRTWRPLPAPPGQQTIGPCELGSNPGSCQHRAP